MGVLRRFWLGLMLLCLGFGPLALQALAQRGCCCTAEVSSSKCDCQERPDSHSHCGLDCAPQLPAAVFPSDPTPTQEHVYAVLFVERLVAILRTVRLEEDSRLSLSAGWVLPSSPPLLESRLNLPPPARC